MKRNKTIRKKWAIFTVLVAAVMVLPALLTSIVKAETGVAFTVSPMKNYVMINPGEEYSSAVDIYIPENYDNDMKYSVEVAPFFVDENYNKDFDNTYGTNNEIVKWITFDSPTEGRLSPGEQTSVGYTINVPEDAPGGGQYAAIMVTANAWSDGGNNNGNDTEDGKINAGVEEVKKIAQTVYAEIAGDVTRQGEITDINVPGFLLSGDIIGTSSVKNTGNVHGDAKYKLQVFPLFSDEEIYTNEEDPDDRTILPDRTLYNETAWEQTPGIGIFNVKYTVEFEGVTAEVTKTVIKCPIWLLFIIIAVIAGIIIWIIMRVRHHGKNGKAKKSTKPTEKTDTTNAD